MFVEWRRDEKRTNQNRRGAECEIPEPRNGGAGSRWKVRQMVKEICEVKGALPGQKISVVITKVRKGKGEGRLKEILEKSPVETVDVENGGCPHFNICGGCSYISMPYEESLKIKENQVRELLEPVLSKQQSVCQIEPIRQSPVYYGYRNKMEFTFGDEVKDGPLALGMHKKGSFYDIVTVDGCRLVDDDYSAILRRNTLLF